MKNLISYAIGILLLLMATGSFTGDNHSITTGLLFLLAGGLCFPQIVRLFNFNLLTKYNTLFAIVLTVIALIFQNSQIDKKSEGQKKETVNVNEKVIEEEIKVEFPNFKYEIIGTLQGFSGNEFVKTDIVFIKVNTCGEDELKYLQKIIQNNEKFPTQIKVGKVEKNVSYEYKIYSVDNINEKVDLKNVKSIYNNSSDIVKLNDYLRKNTKGFCAMLYKMWDLKNYPTYEENFEMFMRP